MILTGQNFVDLKKNVEGLVKCEILPPTNLFHPVLPYKVNAKLLFSLCRTCSENFSQTEDGCHDTDERKLIGTCFIRDKKGFRIRI